MTVVETSNVEERLRWNVRALCLLRRTTRPRSLYPGGVLNAGEVKMLEAAYLSGWTAKEAVRLLVKRDKLEARK